MIAWLLPLCMVLFAGMYALMDDWVDKRKQKRLSAGTENRLK